MSRPPSTPPVASHERPSRDWCATLLLERRWLFKEHDVSRLADTGSSGEGVLRAYQSCERIIGRLRRFLHHRIRQDCSAGGPRVLGALLSFPLERLPGEVVLEGLGSQTILLQHRVTQLAPVDLWHNEWTSIGPLFFFAKGAAMPELQKIQLADNPFEVGPDAALFFARLLKKCLQRKDFFRIH